MSEQQIQKDRQLKAEYNDLLKSINAIDDGSYAICKTPTYRRLNFELKRIATEIADLHGHTGNVHDFFKGSELITGFVIEQVLQGAAA